MTPAAAAALTQTEVATALRHLSGDGQDVNEPDWQENEVSLREGLRLLSACHTASGVKLGIIGAGSSPADVNRVLNEIEVAAGAHPTMSRSCPWSSRR
jgi:hypothetical protein